MGVLCAGMRSLAKSRACGRGRSTPSTRGSGLVLQIAPRRRPLAARAADRLGQMCHPSPGSEPGRRPSPQLCELSVRSDGQPAPDLHRRVRATGAGDPRLPLPERLFDRASQ